MAKKDKKVALLGSIVEATKTKGYTHVDQNADLKALVESGHVEADPTNVVDGKIAVRATAKAVEGAAAAPAAPVAKAAIEITSGLDIPVTTRSVVKEEVYPFSKLEVGQSFFVAIDSDKFASTVSSASRRFAIRTGNKVASKRKPGEMVDELQYTKKFTGRAVKAGQKYSNGFVESADGTRVFRTA